MGKLVWGKVRQNKGEPWEGNALGWGGSGLGFSV